MGKVTIFCLVVSTVVLLVTFGQGMRVLQGGDAAAHLSWAVATLVAVLAANFIAMIHAAQSDRIIRTLRAGLTGAESAPDDPSRGEQSTSSPDRLRDARTL